MERIAVLVSGGLDSAVLVAELAADANVFPIYVEFGLAFVKREARTREQQEAAMAALRFKTDVLWAQLDALHFAYVEPAFIPPGAFVPDDRR